MLKYLLTLFFLFDVFVYLPFIQTSSTNGTIPPTPTPTAIVLSTNTVTPTATLVIGNTVTPLATNTPNVTVIPSNTLTPTRIPLPTFTPTPSLTPTTVGCSGVWYWNTTSIESDQMLSVLRTLYREDVDFQWLYVYLNTSALYPGFNTTICRTDPVFITVVQYLGQPK